ncbi:Signal transduction histidine-protein kinase BaeS [Paenibacillus konkukensis]|uniref:histidine kinase n=1 Tax=Paenibacillus konkukensis TaxID=2020716 RepID=A0ABY4RQA1_9BACL|nr:HAMP domain-containing sensor histidine kinase [Paenibacillus konkukensis]UQZ84696.1 Signal transduction histidine-protein kinase BaeS [Paenibacillus konkukensis]
MNRSITWKLFLLTTALCMLILAAIFAGQTIFFKQFYVTQKVNDIQASLQEYEQKYREAEGGAEAVRRLEQEFYQKHGTWVTTLDALGNLKYTGDFYLEVKLEKSKGEAEAFSNQTITVPLYGLANAEELIPSNSFLRPGSRVVVQGIKQGSAVVPYRLGVEFNVAWENDQIAKKEHEIVPTFEDPSKWHEEFPSVWLNGWITKAQLPGSGSGRLIYTNRWFIDRIKAFQADLLLDPAQEKPRAMTVMNAEDNDIPYKLFIDPITDQDGAPAYLFAMASLQPVDEAVGMIRSYYVYIIAAALLLIVLLSFYYSRQIARPLLRMNRTTKKMASLDFSETLPVTSRDELGALSHNINEMSEALHSHIRQLRQDIEKEKRLERTRKEFIAGVSHELKTPLSVIQSCISILKDGIAEQKREHYFAAVENEVRKMDLLIVEMLELAKFESGTYRMETDAFSIREAIQSVCGQLALNMEEKRLQLHTRLDDAAVTANRNRIGQVLTNFMTNAIRHTPENGSIRIAAVMEEGLVKVSVENQGAPIPPELLDRIWDRFYRGEPSRQRSAGGTGLGLAICKNILELHGAPYGVENTECGVMFYFYLPLQA